MIRPTQISIPTLVRVKEKAIDRVGIYLNRSNHRQVAVLQSKGLQAPLPQRLMHSLQAQNIEVEACIDVVDNDLESAARLFADLPPDVTAIVGLGGGKALDVAKYIGFLLRRPYFAVPTSLSNDGLCSPQSSLLIRGKRRSLPAALPFGLIVDTEICLNAPRILTLSGVGDLVAKFTAIRDWKLAFHATNEPVNDFAAMLSDSSVHAYLSHPTFDLDGIRLLSMALILNGIAMEMAGSSRPASGSEHLISHALDGLASRPRLHGLQVGIAAYIVSKLQKMNTEQIAAVFTATGFWTAIADDPFSRSEWLQAIRAAPSIKSGFYTVLSSRDVIPEVELMLKNDPYLQNCFQD